MGIFRKPSREARTDYYDRINLQGPTSLTSGALLADFLQETDPTRKVTSIAAAYRCIAIISSALAAAPKEVQDIRNGLPRPNSYGSKLLNTPNQLQDAHIWWEQMVVSILLTGNSYYLKKRRPGSAQVEQLVQLPSEKVEPKAVVDKDGTQIDTLYLYRTSSGEKVPLLAEDVLHVPGLGYDGLQGVSVVKACQRVFESAISADELSARYFQEGTFAAGYITTDKRIDERAAEAIKQRWAAYAAGLRNAHQVIVLDSGAEVKPLSLSQEDSQFIQQRQFSVAEIGRIFGVPLALLNEVGERPVSIEEAGLQLVLFCLEGWASRISSAVSRQLLPGPHVLCFNFTKLHQPDLRTRSAASVMFRQTQTKTINEIRQDEGLVPLDDPRANDAFYLSAAPAVGAAGTGANLAKPEQPVPNGQTPQVDYQP